MPKKIHTWIFETPKKNRKLKTPSRNLFFLEKYALNNIVIKIQDRIICLHGLTLEEYWDLMETAHTPKDIPIESLEFIQHASFSGELSYILVIYCGDFINIMYDPYISDLHKRKALVVLLGTIGLKTSLISNIVNLSVRRIQEQLKSYREQGFKSIVTNNSYTPMQ